MRAPAMVIVALTSVTSVIPWADAYTPKTTEAVTTEAAATQAAQTQTLVMSYWGLTAAEYERYQQLMKGIRGFISESNLPPLMALGIHAKTPQERRQYADRLVRVLYQDTERVLAFEREMQAAWRRFGKPMLDTAKIEAVLAQKRRRKAALVAGEAKSGRLALFVAANDRRCPACLSEARRLAARRDLSGLDIYVVDSKEDDAIRQWARRAGITPDQVKNRKITLNHGASYYALHFGAKLPLPAVFARQGGRLVALPGGGG
ncbi:MAG TPA: TIGR03759 family integrating conjugative element protein [Rhodobacteraceae bacterium]|nr:TIGR03759 family integrating conjugative element protein [Paracoccaceae bacterium]